MDRQSLKTVIEATLLAAGEPLSLDRLMRVFPEEQQPEREAVREALETLSADYEGRGLELKEVGSGFRLQVRADYGPWVSRLWEERPARYSRALLETLALIAYRQPITRAEIEDIRGVSVSSNIIKTLQEREWVRVVGHRDVPGKPAMYATTREFLDYFNLKSLDELPPLAELRDIDSIDGTLGFAEGSGAGESVDQPEGSGAAGDGENTDQSEHSEASGDGESANGSEHSGDGEHAAESSDSLEEDEQPALDEVLGTEAAASPDAPEGESESNTDAAGEVSGAEEAMIEAESTQSEEPSREASPQEAPETTESQRERDPSESAGNAAGPASDDQDEEDDDESADSTRLIV